MLRRAIEAGASAYLAKVPLAHVQNDPQVGEVTRVQDEGEALKPFVFVHAKNGNWEVLHDPRK